MLFKIAEGSEFQDFCDDARANGESPAPLDGDAGASVTNNEDLLANIKESAETLEGFNGAAAKAQGQGYSGIIHDVRSDAAISLH